MPATAGFNSRARVGRDFRRSASGASPCCFNSRARVGRDPGGGAAPIRAGVSIHAPAWGATDRPPRDRRRRNVSIHAPAWGATSAAAPWYHKAKFQFTRPRGARLLSLFQTSFPLRFNSRARVGRDIILEQIVEAIRFQFTRPRGARQFSRLLRNLSNVSIHAPAWGATLILAVVDVRPVSFNSRARVGRDAASPPSLRSRKVSIHAPAWGAT